MKEYVEQQKQTNEEKDNLQEDINSHVTEITALKERLEAKSKELTDSSVTLVEQGEKIKDLQETIEGQNNHITNMEHALRASNYGGSGKKNRKGGIDDTDTFESVLRKEFEEMRKKFEK